MLLALPMMIALAAPSAQAADGPPMWGVGPTVGTIAYPGRFPAKLPDDVAGFAKVKNDVQFGAHGVMYIDPDNRIGTHLGLGVGAGYSSIAWTLEYERILKRGSGVQLFAGGGGGFGSYTFKDDTAGKLKVPTYELRGQVGGLYKQKQTAEELSFYLKVPLNGVATLTDKAGAETESKGGNMLHLGLEFTMFFGDFKVRGG